MRFFFTEHFQRNYRDAPFSIQRAFQKQLRFFDRDVHHPSLRAKKYDERNDIWQARVTKAWRFYFVVGQDRITLLDIMRHPK